MNISRTFHSPAGGYHASDDRDRSGRRRRFPAPSRLAAAAGGFPDHSRDRRAARREPGNHGVVRGDAARAAVRPHRRGHRDDVVEHPGLHQHHAAVRSEPQHRRRRARRAGRHQRGPRLSADQPSEQSALPQSESGRFADLHAGAHFDGPRPRARCTMRHPPSWRRSCRRSPAWAR